MATTSLWRIKGYLGGIVLYLENPEKTNNPKYFEKNDMTEKQVQGLSDVIEYTIQKEKTEITDDETLEVIRSYVSGINCSPSTARNEMMAVKKRFGKESGTMAYHGYQSFRAGEVDPDTAHKIGIALAEKLWGDRFQVLIATHLDKESHLHNHFLLNTVSFIDGIKYYRSEKDYYAMQVESDNLCREYGLSVIENPKRGRSMQYAEWRDKKEGKETWRELIKKEIDKIIAESLSEKQFFFNLNKHGFQYKVGKDISVRPPEKERFVRLARNLGNEYTIDKINERILSQTSISAKKQQYNYQPKQYRYQGNFKKRKKLTGFRAQYIYYMYLIGAIPQRHLSAREINFIFREDILKMHEYSGQFRLLAVNKIDTAEQLLLYKSSCEAKLSPLLVGRKKLYKLIDRAKDEKTYAVYKSELAEVSKNVKVLKKQISLCDGILSRSMEMKEKIEKVRQENLQSKEEKKNVQQRRRS